ncbi:AraC family transcriptional regulator [Pedobacter sp. GR22-6]|uniref:AraC family transcriptional regulator n=1 Tax=Pedobacter sp. GR22-6 TaxID=3127957 RepID=UPI00307DB867
MKPKQLKITNNANESFHVRRDAVPNINNRWHYHEELELVCFHQGTGTQFVGDHIQKFNPGDIILLGKELPHYWQFDDDWIARSASSSPLATVIHFRESFIGERFLHLPELKPIREMLEKAKRGVLIPALATSELSQLIIEIAESSGLRRITRLLECLYLIAELKPVFFLSSIGFNCEVGDKSIGRISDIYDYTLSNFKRKIQLEEIASVADLAPPSFCRYFKMHSGKTFSRFLTDVRVGYACKLVLENRMDIKQVCYESGFNNFTSFHRSFKLVTGKTPKEYQISHHLR